jgi:hypothetical protein
MTMLASMDLLAFLILSLITLITAVRQWQIVKVSNSSPPIPLSEELESTDGDDDPNKDRRPGGE